MLFDIFSRQWFERVWTFQELVMAKTAVFLCGSSEISWAAFSSSIMALASHQQRQHPGRQGNGEMFYVSKIQHYQMLRSITMDQRMPAGLRILRNLLPVTGIFKFPLSAIVASACQLNSELPHDAVYGLYGLLQALGVRGLPSIDYNVPLSTVYPEHFRALMAHDRSLELLLYLGAAHAQVGLPSWCLDWSQSIHTRPIPNERFSATHKSKPHFDFARDDLHLYGVEVDTVSEISQSHMPEDIEPEDPLAALPAMVGKINTWQEWARLALQINNDGGLDHDSILTFGRVMLHDGVWGSLQHQQLSEVDSHFLNWFNKLMAYQIQDNNTDQRIALLESDFHEADCHAVVFTRYDAGSERETFEAIIEWRTMMALNAGSSSQVHEHICLNSGSKRLFKTNRGLLGLGASAVQLGDRLLLVRGLQVPMIARSQSNGSWRLVGPAYVHGCMRGEMWPTDCASAMNTFVFT